MFIIAGDKIRLVRSADLLTWIYTIIFGMICLYKACIGAVLTMAGIRSCSITSQGAILQLKELNPDILEVCKVRPVARIFAGGVRMSTASASLKGCYLRPHFVRVEDSLLGNKPYKGEVTKDNNSGFSSSLLAFSLNWFRSL